MATPEWEADAAATEAGWAEEAERYREERDAALQKVVKLRAACLAAGIFLGGLRYGCPQDREAIDTLDSILQDAIVTTEAR